MGVIDQAGAAGRSPPASGQLLRVWIFPAPSAPTSPTNTPAPAATDQHQLVAGAASDQLAAPSTSRALQRSARRWSCQRVVAAHVFAQRLAPRPSVANPAAWRWRRAASAQQAAQLLASPQPERQVENSGAVHRLACRSSRSELSTPQPAARAAGQRSLRPSSAARRRSSAASETTWPRIAARSRDRAAQHARRRCLRAEADREILRSWHHHGVRDAVVLQADGHALPFLPVRRASLSPPGTQRCTTTDCSSAAADAQTFMPRHLLRGAARGSVRRH